MMNEHFKSLVGLRTADILAIYFQPRDGEIGSPQSIIISKPGEKLVGLEPDGHGGIGVHFNVTDTIYFDEDTGYFLIAPLILHFNGKLTGDEKIENIGFDDNQSSTTVRINLNTKANIQLYFEDDEVWTELVDQNTCDHNQS